MNTVSAELPDPSASFAINPPPALIEDQFVDMAFITQYIGLTDKWFYKQIQEGKFPKPVKFGRSSRWLKSRLEAWVQDRIQASP